MDWEGGGEGYGIVEWVGEGYEADAEVEISEIGSVETTACLGGEMEVQDWICLQYFLERLAENVLEGLGVCAGGGEADVEDVSSQSAIMQSQISADDLEW